MPLTGWGCYSHSHSHLTWIPGNAAATWIWWAAPAVFPGKKSGILLGVELQARRFWVYLRCSRRLCFPGAEVADFPRGLAASPFPRRPKKSRKQHLFKSNPKKTPSRGVFTLPLLSREVKLFQVLSAAAGFGNFNVCRRFCALVSGKKNW